MKRLISAGILFVIVIASYLLSLWYINDAEKKNQKTCLSVRAGVLGRRGRIR